MELVNRIGQAKIAFLKTKNVHTNRSWSMEVRNRVLSCYIEPILMYGCEAWIIHNTIKKSIEATEMWFCRRILRIPWIVKQTN